jgi:DNA-binding XRE family transcriptional regulator
MAMRYMSGFPNENARRLDVGLYRLLSRLLECRQMSTPERDSKAFRVYAPASLGAAIKHYREQAGLTQAELAEKASIHRSYLSELETGAETEQLRRILRVLRQLGVRMTLNKADW